MIRSYVLAATAALSAVTGTCALAADPLPTATHKLLPAALAVEAAQTAIATCKGQGYNVWRLQSCRLRYSARDRDWRPADQGWQ
jgi:predicted secreted protein